MGSKSAKALNNVTGRHEEHNDNIESLSFEAMNTSFYIEVYDCRMKHWQDVICGWIRYVEREWSRFQPGNELWHLNHIELSERAPVSPPLSDILTKAEAYRIRTKGLFSPYLLPQMEFHGYSHSFPFLSAESRNNEIPSIYTNENGPFTVDPDSEVITRTANGQLDLGGIAKGYAVQAAAHWLKVSGGASAGIVDGGGDMAVWSLNDKEWKISIAHPYQTDLDIAQFRIKNGGIATSNIIYRSWTQGIEKKHHLLNGRTGLPVETDIIQATVITENCLDAEVMAKMCFMESGPDLEKLLKTIHPHFSLFLVTDEGQIIHKGGGTC